MSCLDAGSLPHHSMCGVRHLCREVGVGGRQDELRSELPEPQATDLTDLKPDGNSPTAHKVPERI